MRERGHSCRLIAWFVHHTTRSTIGCNSMNRILAFPSVNVHNIVSSLMQDTAEEPGPEARGETTSSINAGSHSRRGVTIPFKVQGEHTSRCTHGLLTRPRPVVPPRARSQPAGPGALASSAQSAPRAPCSVRAISALFIEPLFHGHVLDQSQQHLVYAGGRGSYLFP